jgi:hypothetical protein
MAPISQELEPPANPGRFNADFEARILVEAKRYARQGVAALRPIEDIAEFEKSRLTLNGWYN